MIVKIESFGKMLACSIVALMMVGPMQHAFAKDLSVDIEKRGILNVGVGYLVPPMNFIDKKGNHVGFDVDLAVSIATLLGYDYKLVKVNNKTRVTFLVTGKVDLVISSMNHTMGRDKAIDFSEVYLRDGKRVLVKKGRFKTLKDLVGKRIAVVQGSNAGTAIKEKLNELGDQNPRIISFQSNAECFLALKSGKVDGYTNDTVILLGVSGGNPDFEPISEIYSPTFFSMGIAENQSDFRDEVNFALRELHVSGSWQRIYDKWFGLNAKFPLPPVTQGPDIWPL